jgi:hypothetical protein
MRQLFFISTIFCALTFSYTRVGAQSWDWANKIGGVKGDQSKRITADNFGNVYLVGIFQTDTLVLDSDTLFNKGSYDVLIEKTDSLGNIKWAKGAGGTGSDFGCAITNDSQGNIYVTGYFFSSSILFGTTILTNYGGGAQVFITKYDSTGNIIWAKTQSGNAWSTSWGIKTDHSDNIIVTGDFDYHPITYGSVTLNTNGMFVLKFDKNGTAIWGKDGGQEGTSVEIDSLNNIFISGYFNGNATIDSFNLTNNSLSGYSDVYIVKYDSSGNVLWAKSAGSTGLDMAYSVVIDNSGNAYMTGSYGQYYNSSITFGSTTLSNQGNSDVFIVKYDASGNVVWAKSGSGTYEDMGNGLAIDNTGNIYLTGYFDSPTIIFGSQTLTNSSGSGTREMFLVQYNSLGNLIGTISIGGADNDEGIDIAIDNQNNLYFTGTFRSSSINLGTYNLTNSMTGQFEICLGRLGSFASGIPNIDNSNFSIIYPNPFSAQTTFETNTFLHNATLTMDNCFGQTVKEIKNISGQTVILSRDNLASGLYFLRLTQDNKVIVTDKLVITD